jgi:iron complex outermembrane receptor protein
MKAIPPFAAFGFLLLFLPSLAGAQALTLSGRISDAASGEALAGATVQAKRLALGTYSLEDGSYALKIPASAPRPLEIEISYAGYAPARFEIPAEAAGPALTRDIALQPQTVTTDDVVISATKGFAQDLNRVTVSVELVKPRFLDLQALPSVDKALSQVPGVDNQDGQINIRGSSGYAYGIGSRVMVTLDGLPLLSASSGTAALDLIPVDNIAQIEVMKGASSVLYGSSAMGGVISVVSADPGEKPKTSLRLRGGIFDQPFNPALDWDGSASALSGSAHLFHSRKIGPLDLTLQSNFIKETGYRQGTDEEQYRNVLMLKYSPKKIPGLSIGLNASVSIDSSSSILYWRGYYPDTVIRTVNGSRDTSISGGGLTPTLDAGAYRQQLNIESAFDPVIKYLTPGGNLFWYRGRVLSSNYRNNTAQSSQSRISYNDFLYQTTLLKKIKWVSGATYTRSGIRGDSLFGGNYVYKGDTIESDGRHWGASLGVYTQLDGSFGRLSASLGFRYETVTIDSSIRESEPILRAGLNFQAGKGTFLRASFGQAFRVPSVAERFANTSGGGVVVEPNPAIGAERGYSAEAGIRQAFKAEGAAWQVRGFLDLAGFLMEFEDMVEFGITTRRIAFPNVDIRFSSINVANARIPGAELTGLLTVENLGRGLLFSLSGGATRIEPRDLNAVAPENQLDLIRVPTDVLNPDKVDQPPFLKYRSRWTVRASATAAWRGLSLTGNLRYKSFTENIDQYLFLVVDDLAAFRDLYPRGDLVLDLIGAAEITQRQTLSLTVDNLLNREYLIIPGLLAPQRKFTLQYQVRF